MPRNRQLVWITPVHFDHQGRPVDPDYGVDEGAGPDQGLPGGGWGGRPPRPDQGLPGGRPGRPVDPGYDRPGGGWGGEHPDQGLPGGGRPPRPRPPIYHPGHPDHGLPPEGEIPGIPDHELPPGVPVTPGQLPTLPSVPAPLQGKLVVAVHKPNSPPTEWTVTSFDVPPATPDQGLPGSGAAPPTAGQLPGTTPGQPIAPGGTPQPKR
jgi:hypothetical protein